MGQQVLTPDLVSMADNFGPLRPIKLTHRGVKKSAFALVLQPMALTSRHEHV